MPLPRAQLTALVLAAALVPAGVLVVGAGAAGASDADLGSAASFLVLAASTVTNTGPTVVGGDLGLTPGSSVTGFPPGQVVGGTIHVNDGVAGQAEADASTAYSAAAGLPVTETVTADLGGQVLTPGVYDAATGLGLSGTLTLDRGGDPDAAFVLRAGSTLITGSGSDVRLVNGANACNVTWVVGSSATLGTGSTLVGTVLATASITATTGATIRGRLFAANGAVTLDSNVLSRPVCTAAVVPVLPPASPSVTPTATPTASPSVTPSASTSPATSSAPSATPGAAVSVAPSATPSAAAAAPRTPAPGASPSPSPRRAAPAVPQLPRTGSSTATTAAWGALLAAVGAGLALVGSAPARRRRHAATDA